MTGAVATPWGWFAALATVASGDGRRVVMKRFVAGVVLAFAMVFGFVLVSSGTASAGEAGPVVSVASGVDAKVVKRVKESPWCSALRWQPSYSYRYQGATVTVPSGKRLLKYDVYGDGMKPGSKASARACKALVKEFWHHKYGW